MKQVVIPSFAVVLALGSAQAAEWVSGPDLQIPRAGCGVAIDPAGVIRVVGGRLSWSPGPAGTATDTCEAIYTEGTISESTLMSAVMNERREFHACVIVNGFLYAIGGSNSLPSGTVYLATVERLDLLSPGAQWEYILSLNVARNILGAAVDDYGRIYAIGGSNGVDVELDVAERYDPCRPELGWQFLPDLHDDRGRPGVVKDFLGRIVVIGGGINFDNVETVEIFDPSHEEDGWQFGAPIPEEMQLSQAVTATTGADGRIYVPGGSTAQGPVLSRCLRYDPHQDLWETWVSLPSPLYVDSDNMATDREGRMWLIGAYSSTTPSAATRYLTGLCGAGRAVPLAMDVNADRTIGFFDLSQVILSWGLCN